MKNLLILTSILVLLLVSPLFASSNENISANISIIVISSLILTILSRHTSKIVFICLCVPLGAILLYNPWFDTNLLDLAYIALTTFFIFIPLIYLSKGKSKK